MDKLAEIEDQQKYISENEKQINENKIDYIPKKRIEYESTKLPDNKKATVCKICKFNCHNPCSDTSIVGIDVLKYTCKIWTWGFNCIICPNKCPQSCHELSDKIYQKKEIIEYIKIGELVDLSDRVDKINIAKKAINKLKDEEAELKKKISLIQDEIKANFAELRKIAIKCTSYQTSIEFLDELISEEKRLQEKGYKRRIELYEKMKEEKKVLLENLQI